MNTVKHVVTRVLSKPYYKFMWCVDVMTDSWGSEQKTTLTFWNSEEAEKVKAGYEYEA